MDLILNTKLDFVTRGLELLFPDMSARNVEKQAFKSHIDLVRMAHQLFNALRSQQEGFPTEPIRFFCAGAIYAADKHSEDDTQMDLAHKFAFEQYFGYVVGYSVTSEAEGRNPVMHMSNGDRVTVLLASSDAVNI